MNHTSSNKKEHKALKKKCCLLWAAAVPLVLVFLVNVLRQPSFPPVGIHAIIPVLTLRISLPSENCFPGVSVFLIPYHCVWYWFIYSSLLLRFTECVNVSAKGSVCVCKITVVSKRVRAALLHQWLVFQAYICEEINAECWWERYVASDSSPSYSQIDAYTIAHKHTQACTHSGWTQHWFEEDTLAVITEFLTCYFKCICSCAHILTSTQTDAKQTQITASYSLFSPCVSDTWCMYGMKGETYPLLQMVTRPTPNWLSSSWTVKGSGRR